MIGALHGRIVPDGRIQLFDQLVAVASFPHWNRRDEFCQSQARQRPGAGTLIGVPRRASTGSTPKTSITGLMQNANSRFILKRGKQWAAKSSSAALRILPVSPQ